jgi:hypothetical protein
VLVELEARNDALETRGIDGEAMQLVTARGRSYTLSDRAFLDEEPWIYEELGPGLSRTRPLVFDVPRDSARGPVLRVQAFVTPETLGEEQPAGYLALRSATR